MSGPLELEHAAIDIGRCAELAAIIGLAAEGMIMDGDEINGPKIRGAAYILGDRLSELQGQLYEATEAWLRERAET